MIAVKILSSLVGESGQDWLVGEVHEASDGFGRWLIHRGVAVVDAGDLPPAPALTTAAVRNADPVPVNREPPRRKK